MLVTRAVVDAIGDSDYLEFVPIGETQPRIPRTGRAFSASLARATRAARTSRKIGPMNTREDALESLKGVVKRSRLIAEGSSGVVLISRRRLDLPRRCGR